MPLPLASLVWFDPGSTSGIVVFSVDARWLAGEGSGSFEGLGNAVKHHWFAQVGTDSRVWNDDAGKAKPVDDTMRVVPVSAKAEVASLDHLSGYPEYQRLTLNIDQCMDALNAHPRAAWGHESFQLRTMAADLAPVYIIAGLTHSELRYGYGRAPYKQTASLAKTTATDDRLKLAGLYRAGLPHATDAARHGVTILRKARSDAWLRADMWPHLFKQ